MLAKTPPARLAGEIGRLKREADAVILAHNYQLPEVQDVADYVGDSLELSIKAMTAEARLIVFAGVDFMAEQAAILAGRRGKAVLHPEPAARCPMAAMIRASDVRRARERWPGVPIVIYVNSPAEVKAEADYVVTSSSALKLVSQLDADTVVFGPDRHLADYVAEKTGKRIIPIPPRGHCPVHVSIRPEHIVKLRSKIPGARVTVHPECPREVRRLADHVGSTSQMARYPGRVDGKHFIVGTEIGLLHRLRKEHPGKKFYPAAEEAVCVNMKKISLERILRSLRGKVYPVRVPEDIARRTLETLERSFELLGVEVPWRRR